MLPIEPWAWDKRDEELAAIRIRTRIGHRQEILLCVLQFEVLICKFLPVNGFASGSVVVCEVSSLSHKLRDNSVEMRVFESESFGVSAELSKVVCGFRCYVIEEFEDNSTGYAIAEIKFEEDVLRSLRSHELTNTILIMLEICCIVIVLNHHPTNSLLNNQQNHNNIQKLMAYYRVSWISIALFLLFGLLSFAQILPYSHCLGGCAACKPLQPRKCSALNLGNGKIRECAPFYWGMGCTNLIGGYYSQLKQSGNFTGWSSTATQTCNLLSNNQTVPNQTFPSLGPFSNSVNLSRSIQFPSSQSIERLLIKITVASQDPRLFNFTPQASQKVENVSSFDQFGNEIIDQVITDTSTLNLQFLTLDLTDVATGRVILSNKTYYADRSELFTTCGFIYQFLFAFDAPAGTTFTQLNMNFYIAQTTNIINWNLLEAEVDTGCSGFTLSTGGKRCSTCIAGFYPLYTDDGLLEECPHCDYRCSTCTAMKRCVSCQPYTTFNSTSQMCEYASFFTTYTYYNISNGTFLNYTSTATSSLSLTTQLTYAIIVNATASVGQQINITTALPTNQSYLIKFFLLYSQAFANGLQSMVISVNGVQVQNLATLDLYASTLNQGINNSTVKAFIKEIKIDLFGNTSLTNSVSISVVAKSSVSQQFMLSNFYLVQYQCSANCMSCKFDPLQPGTCLRCLPFFNFNNNCLTCVNGFYLKTSVTPNECIKCYSNCKQCYSQSMSACTDCFPNFMLTSYQFDSQCITCIYKTYSNSTGIIPECSSNTCLDQHNIGAITSNPYCLQCLKGPQSDLTTSSTCLACWVSQNLARGKCTPIPSSGYSYYLSDIVNGVISNAWTANPGQLTTYNCTSDYQGIYGVASKNDSIVTPTNLTYRLSSLPAHTGMMILLNIFKIGNWTAAANSTPNATLGKKNNIPQSNLTITLVLSSPSSAPQNLSFNLTDDFGYDICGPSGTDMIFAFQGILQWHTATDPMTLTLISPDDGVFIRQLEIYLGNCSACASGGLSYAVNYLPMYSRNDTQTGLDVYLAFNQPVSVVGMSSNLSAYEAQNQALRSFRFALQNSISNNPIKSQLVSNDLELNNRAHYFLPLTNGFTNDSLTVSTTMGDRIYGSSGDQSILLAKPLTGFSTNTPIDRYEQVGMDDRLSMDQLYDFFRFFCWFGIYTMLVSAFFGIGIIFEEFSIMLQLMFAHIYMISDLLPASFKVPLSGMQKIQNLNFFAYPHARSIQDSWFPFTVPSNQIFQQYNIDIYFMRSLYAVVIINIIFLFWFVVLWIIQRVSISCRQSQSRFIKFFRNIPRRPLNYFDGIWRYQFFTVVWSAFLQFTNFWASSGIQRLNLAVCIIAFVIVILWGLFVMGWTYYQHHYMNVNHFRYQYEDVFYRKISSVADQSKFYLYIGVRFLRYLIYGIFIVFFIQQSVIGPVIIIFANVIQLGLVFFLDIFRDKIYLAFKIIENVGFVISAILILVLYGYSNKTSMSDNQYMDIGYGICTVFILMIINGIVRFLYLGYKKFKDFIQNKYDVGDQGALVNAQPYEKIIPQSNRDIDLPPSAMEIEMAQMKKP